MEKNNFEREIISRKRKTYTQPDLLLVELDNQISLQLESEVPPTYESVQECVKDGVAAINPFKN
ncbi:MAG: hypothetical protein H6Q20_7 [Bacteroidetes bacterium]|jgi:hypothetical protein|nr:hypothetical protein [Bacteroidota bacterium]